MKNKYYWGGYVLALFAMICIQIASGNIFYGLATFWTILSIGHFVKSVQKGESF